MSTTDGRHYLALSPRGSAVIWTSKANIARDLELSRRAVQMAIAELIRDGLVLEAGQRDCKHGYTIEYTIVSGAVDKLVSTREQDSTRESGARVTREPRSHDPVNQIHPNHPKNLTTTPASESSSVDKSGPQTRCLEAGGPGLSPPTDEEIADGTGFPAGFVHIPRGTTAEWTKQLTAEQLMTVKTRQGFQRLEWQQTRDRNEALDCRVYARAAAWLMGMDRWEALAEQLVLGRRETQTLPAGQPQRQVITPPPPRQTGWMGNRRKGNWFWWPGRKVN